MPHRHHAEGALPLRAFERILLIKPSSLGDVIHALPILDGLRKRYPTARIDWLIGSSFASLTGSAVGLHPGSKSATTPR